jgi:hypothetical protein
MTRARVKLHGQQVNSLLVAFDVFDNENFILPKSMHLCMIRVIDNTSVDGGLEEHQGLEHDVPNGAREEREACARGKDEGEDAREEEEPNRHASRPMQVALPVHTPIQIIQCVQLFASPMDVLDESRPELTPRCYGILWYGIEPQLCCTSLIIRYINLAQIFSEALRILIAIS